MKKFLISLLITCMIISLFSSPVIAKSGDIVGVYYATDIKAYLNGVEISAINIGGETLISAEDMAYYGFSVSWYATERELRIYELDLAANGTPPEVHSVQKPSGTVLGYYYETDIVTYLENIPIVAYNIGGRTYVHAEEMRKYGYDVIWNAKDRMLKITSPIRAGYVYNIPISFDVDKGWGNGNHGIDGIGVCSVRYTPDGLIGTDDADYFNMTMGSTGRGYWFNMAFYQTQGLFNSLLLQDRLRSLCYDGYGVENPCDKSEKYELVNQTISITINGNKAEKVSVIGGAGNGHRDFYFEVEDLPKLKKDEINEIVFVVGESVGEPYEIKIPSYITDGPDKIAESLKKSKDDYVVTYYQTDEVYVVFIKEFISLGLVKDRLYIYNRETGEVSDDILEQVRTVAGFQYDVIQPFSFKIGDVPSNFFFACNSPEKTMNFYVDIHTGIVYDLDGQKVSR